jgi:prophage antirepressor-like protein
MCRRNEHDRGLTKTAFCSVIDGVLGTSYFQEKSLANILSISPLKRALAAVLKQFREAMELRGASLEVKTHRKTEKAVSASSRYFYRIIELCDGPEPPGLKSAVMPRSAWNLISRGP